MRLSLRTLTLHNWELKYHKSSQIFFLKKELIETNSLSIKTIGSFYSVNGKQLATQYKNHISHYHQWDQLPNTKEYVLFKQNLGERISMDETCLSQGC